MQIYRIASVPDGKESDELIYATHPAQSRTYIVYAQKDGSTHRSTVVLWGVLDDGTAVPITLSGVWDGVGNRNNFVLHSDGSCSKYEEEWATLEEAIEAVRKYAD